MNYSNPTKLKLGTRGTLAGMQFQVVGRVLMGATEEGVVYYWHEFLLVTDDGKEATLVCEPNDYGAEWKLFTYFEPEEKLTAAEAEQKREGERITIDGARLRVTYCGDSKVYHIEGTAPEGVELGDVAQYFNAERANKMYVVSWTSAEVEYYRGQNLPPGAVKNAFGLPDEKLKGTKNLSSQSSFHENPVTASLIIAAIVAFAGFAIFSVANAPTYRRGPVPTKPPLKESLLNAAMAGTLDGAKYQIIEHRVMEIAQVGKIYDRHEYLLAGGEGRSTLLVLESTPRPIATLFTEFAPSTFLSGEKAASLRRGDPLILDKNHARVTALFQSTVRSISSITTWSAQPNQVFYNFSAEEPGIQWLVRWNREEIKVYRGTTQELETVQKAFLRK